MNVNDYLTKLRELTEQFEEEHHVLVDTVEMDREYTMGIGGTRNFLEPKFHVKICEL